MLGVGGKCFLFNNYWIKISMSSILFAVQDLPPILNYLFI